jgi:group I intron endonuclease
MKTIHSLSELKLYGVYKIKNIITNDYYIGSTIESFQKRKSKHESDFKKFKNENKRASCPILYNAFLKYGINNFVFEIVKNFKIKKDSNQTKKIISYIEEKHIQKENPYYNICQHPTRGGCPNLGKKLSQNWKNKIGEKSKLFKHTGDKMVLQNKKGSSKYKICTSSECFIGSLIDCAAHFDVHPTTILNFYNKKHPSINFISIEKIKSQKKKIIIYIEGVEKCFDSYYQCDKYLNMWRGFTSTQIVNNKKLILTYKYKLLNDDIV